MKLLDKIAKKLGYVPASTLVKPTIIKQVLPVRTFGVNITVPSYDMEMAKADTFNIDRWAKRKLVEKCEDALISCMEIVTEIDKDGNVTYSGRIQVVDMNVED